MKTLFLALSIFLLANFAYAKHKPKDSDYQPATLVSFHTEKTGTSCDKQTDGKVDDSGKFGATTEASCSDNKTRIYVVRMGEQTLNLAPASTGWATIKGSVLRDQLPGAAIEIRSGSSGVYVRVGDKESRFVITEAH